MPRENERNDDDRPARVILAKAMHDDLVRRLFMLRDPDPVIRQWEREDWDRRVRELRTLSPFYGMLAERNRRIFMEREDRFREHCARQRFLRRTARRNDRREQSF
jgi:hypothetical protein